MTARTARREVWLKDTTLREGADTPGVRFGHPERVALLRLLAEAGVPEAEVVAPGHFARDASSCESLRREGIGLLTSGLVYAAAPEARAQIEWGVEHLDRLNLLVPLSERRKPEARADKLRLVGQAVAWARSGRAEVGVGFPHALQAAADLVGDACAEAARAGASRVILYDTAGRADPFEVREAVRDARSRAGIEVHFHGHNDLGMATANSLAAVKGGAAGLEVTVNGLGDRAGNASLEQVAVALHARRVDHGVALERLSALSAQVARWSGIPVHPLAPVVGEFAFVHKSPSHLEAPELFEAFDPSLVGRRRRVEAD